MQSIQLSIVDAAYAAALHEALSHSCAWHVEAVKQPEPSRQCVMVMDWAGFLQLPLPLSNPERVVLIGPKDPQVLADAWDAGIVSVVSPEESMDTVLMAIMAAALRVEKPHDRPTPRRGISPNEAKVSAPIAPEHRNFGSKRCKTQ